MTYTNFYELKSILIHMYLIYKKMKIIYSRKMGNLTGTGSPQINESIKPIENKKAKAIQLSNQND